MVVDTLTAIKSRIEVREYSGARVPESVKRDVLEAARLSQSGLNSQHWRFILVDSRPGIEALAMLSTTGKWVSGADFAVVVLTDPKYPYHLLDAGRCIASMQLAAWSYGVGSRIYTGLNDSGMRKEFSIPPSYSISAVVGFGYPATRVIGKKTRLPLDQVAFRNVFGQPYQ